MDDPKTSPALDADEQAIEDAIERDEFRSVGRSASEISRLEAIARDQHKEWPTHRQHSEFWEELGRAIGAFGFLEEILGRAIFAISGSKGYPPEQITDEMLDDWQRKLLSAVSDPLGKLINDYEAELRADPERGIENWETLVEDLRNLKIWRDLLCHASWQPGASTKSSVPRFVNRKAEVFEGELSEKDFVRIRRSTAEVTCSVISSVTAKGLPFPGSRNST